MQQIIVDTLTFEFEDDWEITKYDEWVFYRNRMSKIDSGIKAVDLLALSPLQELFFIEAKDYRAHTRTKASKIDDEVAKKVLHTLAALLPASLAHGCNDERDFARRALGCRTIRVVLHIEQRPRRSRIEPGISLQNIEVQIRKRLKKAVDAHALVADMSHMRNLAWNCH